MSLEQAVNECSAVMKELIGVLGAKNGETSSTAVTTATTRGPGRPPKEKPPIVTLDQVRAAAQKLSDEKGKPVARKLIGEHGAPSTVEMDPAKYSAFIAAVDVLLKQKPPEPDDDDAEADTDL